MKMNFNEPEIRVEKFAAECVMTGEENIVFDLLSGVLHKFDENEAAIINVFEKNPY